MISTDCGVSFTQAYLKGGATLSTVAGTYTTSIFVPTTTQWRQETINLTPYCGQSNVMVAFQNHGRYGQAIYIDNININGLSSGTAPTSVFTAPAIKCSGISFTLTDASTGSPTSWLWSTTPSTGVTITSANSQNPNILFTTPGTYTLTQTATNSFGNNTSAQTIVIAATPTITVTSQTVCAGTSATITASGATTYSWNTGPTTTAITVTPAATTNYTVTGTSAGCAKSATATVTVNPLPNVIVTSQTVCAGTSATITASGATTYSWNTGPTTTAITITPATTTNYTVTGTSAGCAKSATATVTVNPLPNVSGSSNAAGDSVCSGDLVILSGSGAATYFWSGGIFDATPFIATSTQTYVATGTDVNGCAGNSTTTLFVETCLGVTNLQSSPTFSIFPIPANEVINIKTDFVIGSKREFELLDVMGNLIEKIICTNALFEVSVKHLPSGVYFIRFTGNNEILYKQMLISK